MKLNNHIIGLINQNPLRLKLALALGFTERWITKLIETNKDNGPLTTAKSLQIIREETGLVDSEILEEIVAEEQK